MPDERADATMQHDVHMQAAAEGLREADANFQLAIETLSSEDGEAEQTDRQTDRQTCP